MKRLTLRRASSGRGGERGPREAVRSVPHHPQRPAPPCLVQERTRADWRARWTGWARCRVGGRRQGGCRRRGGPGALGGGARRVLAPAVALTQGAPAHARGVTGPGTPHHHSCTSRVVCTWRVVCTGRLTCCPARALAGGRRAEARVRAGRGHRLHRRPATLPTALRGGAPRVPARPTRVLVYDGPASGLACPAAQCAGSAQRGPVRRGLFGCVGRPPQDLKTAGPRNGSN
jgi:hypothetical protein